MTVAAALQLTGREFPGVALKLAKLTASLPKGRDRAILETAAALFDEPANNEAILGLLTDADPGAVALAMRAVARLHCVEASPIVRAFLRGPTDILFSVAPRSRKRQAVTACRDGTLSLWDLETGKELHRMTGHAGSVSRATVSPDGRWAMSGGEEKVLILWDLDSGKIIRKFEGHTGAITCIAFSPDGKTVLSGSSDKTIAHWEVESGKCLRRFEDPLGAITCITFSPDGKTALSSSEKVLTLWDVSSGKTVRKLEANHDYVTSIVFARDGRRALTGGPGKKGPTLWDVEAGTLLRDFAGAPCLSPCVSFGTDDRTPVSCGPEGSLVIWDVETGKPQQVMKGLGSNRSCFAFGVDGSTLLLGGQDPGLAEWDVKAGRLFDRTPREKQRKQAIDTLVALRDQASLEELARIAGGGVGMSQGSAMEALSSMGGNEGAALLTGLLKARDSWVRDNAAIALKRCPFTKMPEGLEDVFQLTKKEADALEVKRALQERLELPKHLTELATGRKTLDQLPLIKFTLERMNIEVVEREQPLGEGAYAADGTLWISQDVMASLASGLAADLAVVILKLEDADPQVRIEAQSKLLGAGAKSLELLKDRRRAQLKVDDFSFRLDLLILASSRACASMKEGDLRKDYFQRGKAGRLETIRCLGALQASASLVEIGKGENDIDLRASILLALRVARREENEPFLSDQLKATETRVKSGALVALSELGKVTLVQIREAMSSRDSDPAIHQAIADSLFALKDDDLRALVSDLLKSGRPILQNSGLEIVRRKNLPGHESEIRELIGAANLGIQRAAFERLLGTNTEEAAEALAHLSTWNNNEDRRSLVAALLRTASLKPIPVLLTRIQAGESCLHKEYKEYELSLREDAIYLLGQMAMMLDCPQILPSPIAFGSIEVRVDPEDPKDQEKLYRRVCDGRWGKDQAWIQKRGTALVVDFGKTLFLHSMVGIRNGGRPFVFISEDGKNYTRLGYFEGAFRFNEHSMVDGKGRYLRLEANTYAHPPEPAIQEIFFYTLKGESVLSVCQAWWKALEPRLAGYDAARPAIVEIEEKLKTEPRAARVLADKLVEKAPTLYSSYRVRLEARLAAGDFEGAIADGERALALAPDALGVYARIGQVHLSAKRWDKALENAKRTLAAAPGDPRAYYVSACALAGKGEKAAALEALLNAVVCGLSDRNSLLKNPFLESLHGEKRFGEIMELAP